jgi:hypothetical protein
MVWYKPGIETSQCRKVPLRDAREVLVCLGGYGAQGVLSTAIYIEDLLHPTGSLMAGESNVLQITDNTFTCGFDDQDATKLFPVT